MQTVKYTTGREVEVDDGLNGPKQRQTRRLGPRGVLGKTVTRKMVNFFVCFKENLLTIFLHVYMAGLHYTSVHPNSPPHAYVAPHNGGSGSKLTMSSPLPM